ncbi:rod shape-determining protein MreC [Alkaliphilus pronyensis]|uniref:Cell shape-determining protein MreC n=1 Tax=Alkaliphilus pronyensis TaxID=1482732 RepID=A0A6I0FDE1_9FIRM|nr:rod shape-determining protein MreC [Alkaliphilus pronyensis]KAB3535915.1 rod shape-determining protein MreC [Alkaliphilus pronyensis]
MSKRGKKDRTAMIVAIVAIILIIVMGLTTGQRNNLSAIEKWVGNIITPIQGVFSSGINIVGDNISKLVNIGNITRENESLKLRVEELEKQLISTELNRDELEELRGLKFALGYVNDMDTNEPITANIIGKAPGNWFSTFTIDVGEKHGITKNSIVLASNGLVGRVFETGDNWAKVISIVDNDSSVSFQVLRDNKTQGIISGSITSELSGYVFDNLSEIMVGDKLITSGIGIYPEGIMIGEVTAVENNSNQLLKTIQVNPAVNFKRLTKVLVMGAK